LSDERLLRPDDFETAREAISGRVHRTPLLSSRRLGEAVGAELYLKAELFQKTGSFKVRGVLNRLSRLAPGQLAAGLISISAGNHAAALAYGASTVGAAATIVMPAGAIPSKIEATRGYGGEVVLTEANLLETCREIQEERGLTFVHPFDDLRIMAGHGTIGLEILEDLPEIEMLVVPIGGGGLIGGVAAAAKLAKPALEVIGVEPEGADVMSRSLASGRPERLDDLRTIADGLAAPFAGERNLRQVQAFVDRVVRVPDAAIEEALRRIVTRAKLAAEPSGAASYAALLDGAVSVSPGARVVCVVSGGNIDRGVLERIFRRDPVKSPG
jgi:threonine dehydratase